MPTYTILVYDGVSIASASKAEYLDFAHAADATLQTAIILAADLIKAETGNAEIIFEVRENETGRQEAYRLALNRKLLLSAID